MFELKGKYNTAKVYADTVEQSCISQIIELCNLECYKDSNIAIMPDCHAAASCTVGTTMTITNAVTPNLVGADIGCGMFCVELGDIPLDDARLDFIDGIVHGKQMVPHTNYHNYNKYINYNSLHCKNNVDVNDAKMSLGTLGGGNHFIEIDEDEDGCKYLVIHSGSRHLGAQVCKFYQEMANQEKCSRENMIKNQKIIDKLKAEHRDKEISTELSKIKRAKYTKDSMPLFNSSKYFKMYLDDMLLTQYYARMNREAIADDILDCLNINPISSFHTMHNYISLNNNEKILRKGAISANLNEKVLIPLNMHDGSLLCIGKGNKEWNCSAPHGAGRILRRKDAKEQISLDDYKEIMKGIYSSSINKSTIDESPMAYKSMNEIIKNIEPTVNIIKHLKPVYVFKNASNLPSWYLEKHSDYKEE